MLLVKVDRINFRIMYMITCMTEATI